jgi:hypothetical protein
LVIWDSFMLGIILYSCVTSAYFLAFDIPEMLWIELLDILTTIFFAIDIVVNLNRQYRDLDGTFVRSHSLIFTRYFASGWFLLDSAATFPF